MADAVDERDILEPRRDYGTIVVVGGGCYGSQYVRQLRRARVAGKTTWSHLIVVDRDAHCLHVQNVAADPRGVIHLSGAGDSWAAIEFVEAEWASFFDDWLGEAQAAPANHHADAIVPSPLMPHLLFDWLVTRARARWPGGEIAVEVPGELPNVPWQKAGMGGTRYASYATWICPINCIEPKKCPHTGGPRDWSFHESLTTGAGRAAVLRVTHRHFGVGMIDLSDVLAADAWIADTLPARGMARIATASHCHAAIGGIAMRGP